MEIEKKEDSSSNDDYGSGLGFEINTTPGKHNKFIIPEYECKRKYKLTGAAIENKDELQAKRPRFGLACWNCGETGHSNRDCKEPSNPVKFAQNRQLFMKSRPVRNGVQRYHLENEQRFSHFLPGVISKKLRRALGLNKNQLPRHIYNMRFLGYPEGWLEEAKVVHSGITLFDSKGNVVADPDDEEGEVVDDAEIRNKYDLNKLIKYPGFNVPPLPDTIDESEKFGAPPLRIEQSLDNLITSLKPNEAKTYRRQKVPIIPSASPPRGDDIKVDDFNTDMDYEETPEVGFLPEDDCKFIPSLPDDEVPPPPPPPPEDIPGPSSESIAVEDGDCSSQSVGSLSNEQRLSPTLIELQEQKASILSELNNTASSFKEKEILSPTINRVQQQSNVSSRTPSPNLGRMKSVDLGTPVLKNVSPFSKLPTPESFSQNICDVINFENLPNSTGVYNNLVNVLNKVRTTVKRLNP